MRFRKTDLVFFKAVLEDVLYYQAASLTQGNFVPHTAKSLVDIAHDLRWGVTPAEFEQLLPHMAGIAVNDGLRDTTKQLVDHGRLVFLWHAVKSFLNDMATESVHAQGKRITTDSLSDGNDLLLRAMLEAALYKKVAKAIDHESIRLGDDRFDYLILLLGCTNFELLLEEYGGLLIVVADDLVDDVLPVAAHVTV